MKIATNVHRDAFGGITISNLALFDWLKNKKDRIVGIEFLISRHILGPTIFRRYDPSFFHHHIVNGVDIVPIISWEKMVGNLRKRWNVLIETTKKVLREEAPDIVLVNGTYYASWIMAQAAKELDIPIVLRYAGILQREVSHKNYFVRRRLLHYEQWIARVSDTIIFPSMLCQKVVEEEILGEPVKRSAIIPNPATAKRFVARHHKQFTISAIGRWSYIKNFQSLIEVHKKLLEQHWPHRANLVTSYRDDSFGIPSTIERIDPMSHEAILKFYRSIDVLMVPSHFETFCNVAAEALLSGASVLVSEQVGFAEILRKAKLERMIIPSFDSVDEVVKAVKRLSEEKLTVSEHKKVTDLLDPHAIHDRIRDEFVAVLK